MKKINRLTDFTLTIGLKNSSGQAVTPPSTPWEVHISDKDGTCWRCSFDGTNYEDCAVVNDKIVCFVDNPQFVAGKASVMFVNKVPNTNFADGVFDKVMPLEDEIWFVDGPSDQDSELDTSVVIEYFDGLDNYLTIEDAAETYLTQTDAASTYDQKPLIVSYIVDTVPSAGITVNYSGIVAALAAGKRVYFSYPYYNTHVLLEGYYNGVDVFFEGIYSAFAGGPTYRYFTRIRVSSTGGTSVDTQTVMNFENYLTSLTKGNTTGNGNAVTDMTVSGSTITLTKGSTFTTATDVDNSIADKCYTAVKINNTNNNTSTWVYLHGEFTQSDLATIVSGGTSDKQINLSAFVSVCGNYLTGDVAYTIKACDAYYDNSTPVFCNVFDLIGYNNAEGFLFACVGNSPTLSSSFGTPYLLTYSLVDDGFGNMVWEYYEGDIITWLDNKANKSEMSVVAGTGNNADKTTITLKTGTAATVLTTHQDVSGKADKTATASTVPQTGMLPNVVYNLGTTDTVTVTLDTSDTSATQKIWCFTFTAQTTACSVTLPSGVELGNEYAWEMVADRFYEVSISNNMALVSYYDPAANNS